MIIQEQYFVVYSEDGEDDKVVSGPFWDYDQADDALRIAQRKAMFEYRYSIKSHKVTLHLF